MIENKFFEKLNTVRNAIRLNRERKDAIRARIIRAMDETEMGETRVRESLPRRLYIQTSKQINVRNFLRPMPIFAAFTILVTLLGGSVTYAAQTSLPGELLYPVKIVGENLRGDLTFSADARAAWNAQLVGNRLEEASVLAAEHGLNATTTAIVASNFDRNAKAADTSIQALQAQGNVTAAADVASGLEASLRAHQEIIARFEAGSSTLAAVFAPIKAHVYAELGDATKLSDALDEEITASSTPAVRAAAEGKMRAATNAILEAQRFVDIKRGAISADGAAEADAKLRSASSSLATAEAQVGAGAYADAFHAADDAFQTAQEAKTLVQVQAGLGLKLTRDEGRGDATSTPAGGNEGESTSSWSQVRIDGMIHTETRGGQFEATSTENEAATSTVSGERGGQEGSAQRAGGEGGNGSADIRANVRAGISASSSDSAAEGDGGFRFQF